MVFTVTKGGCWFQGFWWWVCTSGQSTGPTKMCLWSATSNGNGVVVPGTTVTSGPLTPGAWNYMPLPVPVQLSIGGPYIAAVGVNGGPFADSQGWWGANAPNGITNGPLFAFGTQGGGQPWPATPQAPYNCPQGCFTTGGSAADPTTAIPFATSSTDNFWVDVQISDTPPPGYNGSYRLWPNRYDYSAYTQADSEVAYTVGTEVVLSAASTLKKIWYVSPGGGNPAPTMATEATVWNVATQASVADFPSPNWQSIIGGGGSPGFGWVFVDVSASNIVLPAGTYRVTVFNNTGTSTGGNPGQWSAKYLDYWGTDASSGTVATNSEAPNGISSGPLFAPSPTSAPAATPSYVFNDDSAGTPPYSNGQQMSGQSVFAMPLVASPTGPSYPNLYVTNGIPSGNNAYTQNYWVDMEVVPVPSPALRSGSFLTFFP